MMATLLQTKCCSRLSRDSISSKQFLFTFKTCFMLILPSISQLNEVIKTSQAILQSPVARAIQFAGSMRYLLNSVYRQRPTPLDPLDIAAAIVQHVTTNANSKSHVRYSKVKITWGDLQPANRATAIAVEGGVQFTWHDNTGEGNAKADDKSILIAYCKSWNRFRFNAVGAERHKGSDTLALSDLRGQSIHAWLAFISADEMKVSNSAYIGRMRVL
jgi:hypothetical protein